MLDFSIGRADFATSMGRIWREARGQDWTGQNARAAHRDGRVGFSRREYYHGQVMVLNCGSGCRGAFYNG